MEYTENMIKSYEIISHYFLKELSHLNQNKKIISSPKIQVNINPGSQENTGNTGVDVVTNHMQISLKKLYI